MCTVYSVDDTNGMETGDKYKRFSWMNVKHGLCKLESFDIPTDRKRYIIKFDCDAREIVHIIETENTVFVGFQISFVVVCIVILFSERLLSTYNRVAHFGIPQIVMDMNVHIGGFELFSHLRSN